MVKWENKNSVNILEIDEEHRYFILIMNKTITLIKEKDKSEKNSKVLAGILIEMMLYAFSLFKTEEKYMKKLNFPEYQQHKDEHNDFLMTTVNFHQKVMNGNYNTDNLFKYQKQWLANHIQGSDRKYTKFFYKN